MDPAEASGAAAPQETTTAPAAAPQAGEMQGHEVAPKPKGGQANKVLHQIDDRFKKTMEEVTGIDKMITEIKATSEANIDKTTKQLGDLNETLGKLNERFDAMEAQMDAMMKQLGGTSAEES